MKKSSRRNFLLTIFFGINIAFIFLQIYKQSYIVKLSYQKQKYENEKNKLIQKKDALNEELHEQKNPNVIKNFAEKSLGMEKTKLNQINKISLNE